MVICAQWVYTRWDVYVISAEQKNRVLSVLESRFCFVRVQGFWLISAKNLAPLLFGVCPKIKTNSQSNVSEAAKRVRFAVQKGRNCLSGKCDSKIVFVQWTLFMLPSTFKWITG